MISLIPDLLVLSVHDNHYISWLYSTNRSFDCSFKSMFSEVILSEPMPGSKSRKQLLF